MVDYVKQHIYEPFMKTGKRQSNATDQRQQTLYSMYLRTLGELCMNRFEWKGFPESVDVRFLEMQLYFSALAVAFVDKNTGKLFVLGGSPSGQRNLVDNPVSFTLSSPSLMAARMPKQVSARQSVPIWANYFRVSDIDIVQNYAFKLAQIDRTIEININSARRTKVIVHNENQRLSAANINAQLDKGDSVVAVNQPLDGMFTALDMGVTPDSIEKLSIVRGRLWNECMGLLGINNSNQDKKERLVAAEVDANDDQVSTARRVNLNARQAAAELINKKFADVLEGRTVSVEYYKGEEPIHEPIDGGE